MRKLLLISCSLFALTPAIAQTIDANGAKELGATLSKYVGKKAIEKEIIKVVPDGDSYRITLSTVKLLEALPKQDYVKGSFGEYSLLTKPLADGSWAINSKTLPEGSLEIAAPMGPETMQWSIDNADISGIFDPKLGTFSQASFTYGSFKMKSSSPIQDMEASADSAKGEMLATAGASGGVDFSTVQSAANFKETLTFKSAPAADETVADGEVKPAVPALPAEPIKVAIQANNLGVDGKGSGFRYVELLDLWAFFLAHSKETKLADADQAELKSKLLAALPVWNKLSGAYNLADLNVETPLGVFLTKNISQEMNLDGVSKSGGYHYALKTNGLKYPALPIPEWSIPFLPTDVELAFGATDIDLDTVVRGAIAEMDLNKDKPLSDEFTANTAAAFMLNPPKVVISKSLVRTADAEITVEGEVTFAALKPQSRTTWEMEGFDGVVERLTKASEQEPEIKNYIVFAKLAKDFGTQLPNGHIQWIVDQKADGSVAVNGNPVKGPDPIVAPGGDDTLDGTAPDDDMTIVPNDTEDGEATPNPVQ